MRVVLLMRNVFFLQEMANFMSKVRGGRVKFDPDRILMSGGATGANELIMFCLADPGDAFMIPTPFYPGYVLSLSIITFVHSMYVTVVLTHHTLKVEKGKHAFIKPYNYIFVLN